MICHILCNITRKIGGSNPITKYSKIHEYSHEVGKTVEESKSTNDVVDIVMSKGTSSNTASKISDGFSAIAERAFKRERQISHTPFSINKREMQDRSI